jgi:acyl-CoA reductase-like NAD-dependent aldehyde dehydrogenase
MEIAFATELDVVDPASGDRIASVPAATEADVDRAVASARRAFPSWSQWAPPEREAVLRRLADLLEVHATELACTESLDVGKPLSEACADVTEAINVLRYYAGWTTKIAGDVVDVGSDRLAYVERRPIGVVGAIVPWNFPLVMATYKIGPALAAGCCVILKPAELTPLTSIRLGELATEAGLPAGVLQILPGFGAVAGAALARHPGIDKISFTGSTMVGRDVAAAAAAHGTRVALELGGKSAQLVFADADLDSAVDGIVWGALYNAGQVCVAGTRLLVDRRVQHDLIDAVVDRVRSLRVGPGLDETTQIGPVVSQQQRERVLAHVDRALAHGAQCATGSRPRDGEGWFVEPTVLTDITPQHDIFADEVFGPVITVTPFEREDDAIALAEATPYGLAAGIWSNDVGRVHRVARALRVGTVWANCYGEFHPNVPFGGAKASGYGRELGAEGLRAHLETTSTIVAIGAVA